MAGRDVMERKVQRSGGIFDWRFSIDGLSEPPRLDFRLTICDLRVGDRTCDLASAFRELRTANCLNAGEERRTSNRPNDGDSHHRRPPSPASIENRQSKMAGPSYERRTARTTPIPTTLAHPGVNRKSSIENAQASRAWRHRSSRFVGRSSPGARFRVRRLARYTVHNARSNSPRGFPGRRYARRPCSPRLLTFLFPLSSFLFPLSSFLFPLTRSPACPVSNLQNSPTPKASTNS